VGETGRLLVEDLVPPRADEQVPVADAVARFAHDLAVVGWDTAVIA
jgi:hypothetical protein